MFYSQFILAKKGPLGTIWIAAHLERKLRKNQVTETNIGVSVDSILFPEVPIALRLSGHLLLGVVRIYSRKVNYLFHDCSEALVKIKQAFHAGAVDLPPESATAPIHAITLPENFDLDDLELLPDREALFLANSSIDHHVTSREQITLQDTVDETAYASQFGLDDRLDATRMEFDEDVIPVQTNEDQEEENPRLDEDNVATGEEDEHQVDDESRLHEEPAPEPVDVHMQDLPDLNEEQPPEEDEAAEEEKMDTTDVPAEASAVLPEMVSSEETGDKQPADASVPEDEQKSEESPVEEQELATEQPVVSEGKEAITEEEGEGEGEAVPETNDKTAEEEQVPVTDAVDTDKEPLETEKANGSVLENEELMQEVPDVEKVRSSADFPDSETSLLELHTPGVPDSSSHEEDPVKAKEVEETPVLKHDGQQDAEETPLLKQDAPSEMRTSPRVSELAGDDDVLASILGRRSLKVAPTPDLPPAKRHKPAPKPVSKKRKVQVDDATVLHGDDMRLQLSDTNDIRRVRKRAPCTEYEIWNAEKEAQGQLIFEEPVVLGFCDNVRELYRSLWDAKRPAESEPNEPTAKQKHQLDYEETEEAITLAEEPLDDYLFYDLQRTYPFEEPHAAEERDTSVTAPPSSTVEAQPPEETGGPLQQTDSSSEENKEKSPAVEKPDANHEVEAEIPGGEQSPAVEGLEDNAPEEVIVPTPDTQPDVSKDLAEAPVAVSSGEGLQEEETVNDLNASEPPVEAEVVEANRDVETDVLAEEPVVNEEEPVQEEQSVELEQKEEVVAEVVAPVVQPPEEETPAESDHDGVAAEGLGFLTDAKDDEADDGENGDVEYIEPQVQDNSGWSVRTRAVCQYLRVSFESMESSRKERDVPARIGLERLLQGKTRRESARMFFESLVLKTKDYINIEQDAPFDNIYITARSKLMKADM